MTNGEAMTAMYAALGETEPVKRLKRIHARIVAARHAGDKEELRRAWRAYRRALNTSAKTSKET